MKRFVWVFLCALGLLLSPRILHATTYVIAGTCKPSLPSYPTISAAVAAAPAGATVEVCPGIYAEQVVIDTPLTLEGITIGNTSRAVIAAPAAGLTVNASSVTQGPVAAQVLVETGPVNITNITVDGSNSGLDSIGPATPVTAGIFYESGSSGTVNNVTVRQELGGDGGLGIWAENENTPAESVTIENSDVHDLSQYGIYADTTESLLTVTIKGNTVAGESVLLVGILNEGATGSIMSNVVSDFSGVGIADGGSTMLISGNSTTNTEGDTGGFGMSLFGTGQTVKSNSIMNNNASSAGGIMISTSSPPTIQDNKIVNSNVAIEFACNSGTVSGNTIIDAAIALDQLPSLASTNFYYGVDTIRTDCSPAEASAMKARAASLLKKSQLPQ